MQDTKVAHRYALSLFRLAEERKEVEAVSQDMSLIDKTIRESQELELLLKSPVIKADKKEAIFNLIFEKHIGKTTHSFVRLIIRKRREKFVHQIARQFVVLYLENNGTEEATLTTPWPVDEEFRKKIISLVERNSKNSKVVLEEKIDTSLIGGFVLRFGDRQIDSSLVREMELLRREFDKNLYIKNY